MLHSLYLFDTQLALIRKALRTLDDDSLKAYATNPEPQYRILRSVKAVDVIPLLRRLDTFNNADKVSETDRYVFSTEEIELIASALVYSDNGEKKNSDRELYKTLGEHLGHRFY
jgi:hypothetical protein